MAWNSPPKALMAKIEHIECSLRLWCLHWWLERELLRQVLQREWGQSGGRANGGKRRQEMKLGRL
ncbi:hypothetical protein ACSBR2_035546 [Camellia fascicularis]